MQADSSGYRVLWAATGWRFYFLLWLSVPVLGGETGATESTSDRRPNVLFLISDDLNNMLGCYGDRLAKTPQIDRLAARGVRFELAYCSFPLCGPSRNSMLTGLYPNSTGIFANAQIFRQTIPAHRSLPQAFRNAGYFAARIGKLYHYNVPLSVGTHGHDDPGSWEMELNEAGVDRLEEHPHIFSLVPGQFGGTLSWYASPKSDEDQQDIPEAGLGSYKREQDLLTDDLRRQCRQAYNASISFMDAQVGRVVRSLDRLGLADNTIIVFTSDHGYHMGEHGLWQKMSLFEESARVPLLIVAPGVTTAGSVASSPVSLVDLYPTLTELCAVPEPETLQGQSLVPMLKDPAFTGRGWALTQVTRGGGGNAGSPQDRRAFGYSLRTLRWRYTEWDEGRRGRELYDHESDPREITNLAAADQHSSQIAELSAQLREAIRLTYPPSGETPAVRPGIWAPNLTDP